jgi:hypothetical protein
MAATQGQGNGAERQSLPTKPPRTRTHPTSHACALQGKRATINTPAHGPDWPNAEGWEASFAFFDLFAA